MIGMPEKKRSGRLKNTIVYRYAWKLLGSFQFFAWDWNPPREYVIEPTALEHGTARAIGSVAYCSSGFQSVACFRLRKIEICPNYWNLV